MINNRKFLRCSVCGNIVGFIHDSGVTPVCCNQSMNELTPNTTDAAQEKHVPVITREGNVVTVKVGSVSHPMTPEHHIAWILIAYGSHTQRFVLDPAGAPEATFCVQSEEPVTAYEYCNLHGLWAAEL